MNDRIKGPGPETGFGSVKDTGMESGPGQADEQEREEELSVEEAFAELERIVKQMESDDIALEESFACYERGIRLVRYCNDRIDRVEKKVRMLRGEGEAPLQEET